MAKGTESTYAVTNELGGPTKKKKAPRKYLVDEQDLTEIKSLRELRPSAVWPTMLPDDDSLRLFQMAYPQPSRIGCHKAAVGAKGNEPGETGHRDSCWQKAKAQRLLSRKEGGEDLAATAATFRDIREKCLSDANWEGGSPGRTDKGCDYWEGEGSSFLRDNRDRKISAAVEYWEDRTRPFNQFSALPGDQYCMGPSDRLSADGATRFCSCKPAVEDAAELSEGGSERKAFVSLPKSMEDGNEITVNRRSSFFFLSNDYLMVQSFRDLGVNWWQEDEVVEYLDFDPCGVAPRQAKGGPAKGGAFLETKEDSGNTTAKSSSCGEVEDEEEENVSTKVVNPTKIVDPAGKPKPKPKKNPGRKGNTPVPPGFETFGLTKLPLKGAAEQGDFFRNVYEYYGPLMQKMIDLDHGGDLSKVAMYSSSEGGSFCRP
eukprot:g12235.t1